MRRRAFLRTGGPALLALAAGGCATRVSPQTVPAGPQQPKRLVNLVPVKCSIDRVVRTTVGLRPVRQSGFLLRADRLDDKVLIHNYGHGGSGMTLSWGTGFLAADLAMVHAERRAAVIGCGIVGLTAARQMQRRGFDVTIYAMDVPPNTTSNMSLANFEAGTLSYPREQARHAAEIAYKEHQLLVGSHYGVRWIHHYSFGDTPPAAPPAQPTSSIYYPIGWELFGPGEHPFPGTYALQRSQLHFDPFIYLDALMRDVITFGGRIVVRKFDTVPDIMTLTERVIINCTGLGSKALFGDEELTSVKGQSTVLIPQPDVTYRIANLTPRTDGIVLGATEEPDNWTLDVDEAARGQIVERMARIFNSMRAPLPGVPITGLG